MFLAKILKIENFRLFDIDTPIDDPRAKKVENFQSLKISLKTCS